MSQLKRNLIANYVGQAWSALAGLVFVPFYIRYLGIEAYGVIGLFTLIQVWLTLLDIGMTPTLSREMARYTSGMRSLATTCNLLRTMEILCFGIAVVIAAGVWLSSDFLAHHWLNAKHLSPKTIASAISVMAIVAAFRFVEGIYRGSLMGLQRQVWYNVASVFFSTLRWGGACLALIVFSPTLHTFFLFQASVSLLSVVTLGIGTHAYLGHSPEPVRFSRDALSQVWKFAGGMMGITALSLLLTQVDKILLTRLLPLEMFAYYSLAGTLAGTFYTVVSPVTAAIFPRLVQFARHDSQADLANVYHSGSQLLSSLIAPLAVLLVLFSGDVVFAWTGRADTAALTSPILSALAFGTALNALMSMPYQSQIAHGWTSFAIKVNLVASFVVVPTLLWVVPRYGAVGAAWVWCILNSVYSSFVVYFTHRKVLPGELKDWYLRDVVPPLGAAMVFGIVASYFAPAQYHDRLLWVGYLIAVGTTSLALAVFSASRMRALFLRNLPIFKRTGKYPKDRLPAREIVAIPGESVHETSLAADKLFSVVIPTMNRPSQLAVTVESVIRQICGDFELIVSDNSNDPVMREQNRETLARYSDDPRVRLISPPAWLNMPDHWEFATRNATGKYVVVLTDRFAMRPSALAFLRDQFLELPDECQVASWHSGSSFLGSGIVHTADFSGSTEIRRSSQLIREYASCANWRTSPLWVNRLPRILVSAYRNELARTIREKHGRIFRAIAPDYVGAYLFLAYSEKVAYFDRPLLMNHGWESNGQNVVIHGLHKYVATLGDLEPTLSVPFEFPTVTDAIVRDLMLVKGLVGERFSDVVVDPVGYLMCNYREFLYMERLGSQMDMGRYYQMWRQAVDTLSTDDRALVAQHVRALQESRPRLRGVRRFMVGRQLDRQYHAVGTTLRNLRHRLLGRPIYPDALSAVALTDHFVRGTDG